MSARAPIGNVHAHPGHRISRLLGQEWHADWIPTLPDGPAGPVLRAIRPPRARAGTSPPPARSGTAASAAHPPAAWPGPRPRTTIRCEGELTCFNLNSNPSPRNSSEARCHGAESRPQIPAATRALPRPATQQSTALRRDPWGPGQTQAEIATRSAQFHPGQSLLLHLHRLAGVQVVHRQVHQAVPIRSHRSTQSPLNQCLFLSRGSFVHGPQF